MQSNMARWCLCTNPVATVHMSVSKNGIHQATYCTAAGVCCTWQQILLCGFDSNLSNRGVDQTCLFQDMPHCMQADVSLSVMEQLLKKVRRNCLLSLSHLCVSFSAIHRPIQVPVFQDCETAFLRHLSLTAKPLIFLPGEYIVRKGDIGYGLFLICSGKVSTELLCIFCIEYSLYVHSWSL